MVDKEGYRPNVGIVLLNKKGLVLWGKRVGQNSWQFPQGGIEFRESPLDAMYRELYEEIGLSSEHVSVIGRTRDWLRYDVPRVAQRGRYKGQKQIWFLLKFCGNNSHINLNVTQHPEFDCWQWRTYGSSLDTVIDFKRRVYELALAELVSFLPHQFARQYAMRMGVSAENYINRKIFSETLSASLMASLPISKASSASSSFTSSLSSVITSDEKSAVEQKSDGIE